MNTEKTKDAAGIRRIKKFIFDLYRKIGEKNIKTKR